MDKQRTMVEPMSSNPRTDRLPRLGLIGGMSWRSTADYYARINEISETRCGAHHNAALMIDSLEFAPLLEAGGRGAWHEVEAEFIAAGRRLQAAGCVAVGLTAVTAHRCHEAVAAALSIPVPHIFDAAAAELAAENILRVGLLGTSRTLAAPFLLDRMAGQAAREILRPDADMQGRLDALIFERLTQGIVDDDGRALMDSAIAALRGDGAEAIVLACTELPLLLRPDHAAAGIIDAAALHASFLYDTAMDAQS